MWYGYLADLIVAVHVAYIAYVVAGQALIVLGSCLRWDWVRNPWFRFSHLLAIGVVPVEEWKNWRCPLREWEEHPRLLGGQSVTGETFMGRFLHELMFVDDRLSMDAITMLHY